MEALVACGLLFYVVVKIRSTILTLVAVSVLGTWGCSAERPGSGSVIIEPDDPPPRPPAEPSSFRLLAMPAKTSWETIKCAGHGTPGHEIHIRNTTTNRTSIPARVAANGTWCVDINLKTDSKNEIEIQSFGDAPSEVKKVALVHETASNREDERPPVIERRRGASRLSPNPLLDIVATTNMTVRDGVTGRASEAEARDLALLSNGRTGDIVRLQPDSRATNWIRFALPANAELEQLDLVAPCLTDYDLYLSSQVHDPGAPGAADWGDAVWSVSDARAEQQIPLLPAHDVRWVGLLVRGEGCPVPGVPGVKAFAVEEITAKRRPGDEDDTTLPVVPLDEPEHRLAPICANHER